MKIGEFAGRAGLTTRQIRYWSQEGLLPQRRDTNGYRDFSDGDLHTARRISDMLTAGLTIRQITRLQSCLNYERGVCSQEREALAARVRAIEGRIACLDRTRSLIEDVLEHAPLITEEEKMAESAADERRGADGGSRGSRHAHRAGLVTASASERGGGR